VDELKVISNNEFTKTEMNDPRKSRTIPPQISLPSWGLAFLPGVPKLGLGVPSGSAKLGLGVPSGSAKLGLGVPSGSAKHQLGLWMGCSL